MRSEGFDVALSAQPIDGLTLDVAVGYVDARFTRPVFTTRSAASGPISINAGNALFQAGTPWQVAVGGRYDFTVAGLDAFVRANHEFASDNWRLESRYDPATAFFNPIVPPRRGYDVTRVRAGVTFDALEAQLFVDNVFNTSEGLEATNYGGRSPFLVNYSLRPRTFGLTLIYRQYSTARAARMPSASELQVFESVDWLSH